MKRPRVKENFMLAYTNHYSLQRIQPLEQHKLPAVNYMLKDPQYFLHYFDDNELFQIFADAIRTPVRVQHEYYSYSFWNSSSRSSRFSSSVGR